MLLSCSQWLPVALIGTSVAQRSGNVEYLSTYGMLHGLSTRGVLLTASDPVSYVTSSKKQTFDAVGTCGRTGHLGFVSA